jgi:cytochrome c
MPLPSLEEAPRLSMTTQQRGRHYFLASCANCHSLTGEVGIGPPLNGIIGRRVGGYPNFGYSTALAGHGGVWTDSLLRSFIVHPKGVIPGTAMEEIGLYTPEGEDIAAYLKTTR